MGGADSLQAKVLNFMGRPEAYRPPSTTLERIETHASIVFLAGDFAYKVKKAVKYPFLDFSTLEKRRRACLNELRVNRLTAPELYLDVFPVTRDKRGDFRLGGDGEPVEWVLRDDQSKPELTRTLYEQLITAEKVDLIQSPYATASILAAMGVAQRYGKVLLHNSFGIPTSRRCSRSIWAFTAPV